MTYLTDILSQRGGDERRLGCGVNALSGLNYEVSCSIPARIVEDVI